MKPRIVTRRSRGAKRRRLELSMFVPLEVDRAARPDLRLVKNREAEALDVLQRWTAAKYRLAVVRLAERPDPRGGS